MQEPNPTTIKLQLYLSLLRSQYNVGRALLERFPTEESWEAARSSEEFISDLNHFTTVLDDVKTGALKVEDEEEVVKYVENTYDLLVDSVSLFAEKYEIPVEDFVYVLMQG